MLLLCMLVIGFAAMPFSFASLVHAEHHRNPAHASDNSNLPAHADHDSHLGHVLVHCGGSACLSSFFYGGALAVPSSSALSLTVRFAADERFLIPFILVGDPPVPRGGFSLI